MDYRPKQFEDLHLREYWRVLRRRWRIAVAVAGLIFIAGTVAMFARRPLYQGKATVLVEESRGSQFEVFGDLSGLGRGAIPVETEMELIKSRTIAEQVVAGVGLDVQPDRYEIGKRLAVSKYESSRFAPETLPEFRGVAGKDGAYTLFGPGGEKLGQGTSGQVFRSDGLTLYLVLTGYAPGESFGFTKLPFQDAVTALQDRMEVKEVGKKTNLIRISVDLPEPHLARDTANQITDQYVAMNVARKSQEASQMLEFIEGQLESIRGNLEKGERELDELKSEKGIFILSESAQKLIGQISQLELSRASLQLQQKQVAALYESIQKSSDDAPYLLGNVSMPDPLLVQMIGDLSRKLVELRGARLELTDNNPRVRFLQAEVDELKKKVSATVLNAKRSLDNQMATMNRIIGGYEAQLRALPQAERLLAALTRKSAVNAELYTFLLKKHEEARISRAGIVGNVRVIDPALAVLEPVAPKKKRGFALILLAGAFLGVLTAFLMEYFDDSLKSLEDVEQRLGQSVYGVIPFVEHATETMVTLATIDPRSPIQEAYRSLRTNIQFGEADQRIKTILCTSALPGVGKTTTIVNLAMALAQDGASVLMVDCDLRRPRVHRFFSLGMEPGLTNALMNAKTWEESVHAVPAYGKLWVLPSGTIPPNPAETLGSARFKEFLRKAKETYDYVLLDIPPVVAFTDAAVVAAQMDAVFVVVELGKSSTPLTQRALALLQNVQAKIRGVIVNKVNAAHADGSYYYGYAYSYSHYYGKGGGEKPAAGLVAKLKTLFHS